MAFKVEVTSLLMFDPIIRSQFPQSAWKSRFETYISAIDVTDDTQKRALLLYQETQELFDTFTDTGTDYATAMNKLDTYFNPPKMYCNENYYATAMNKLDTYFNPPKMYCNEN